MLVLVLLLLAIAAAALAGVSRASVQAALHASRAQDDLQRRWAVATCRSVLLPRAEAVLAAAEAPGPGGARGAPAAEVRRDVQLGGVTFTLVFGDEQAKANVNRAYRDGGLAAADRAVRDAVRSADVRVDLRPLPDAAPPRRARPGGGGGAARRDEEEADEPPPAFESLGQVFAVDGPAALVDGPAAPAATVTCWGTGALNVHRASADALRAACGRHLGGAQVARVLQIRAREPDLAAVEILDRLQLRDADREALEERLVDDSACHSLWVITHGQGRRWYDLAVAEDDGGSGAGGAGGARPRVFSW